MAGPQSEAPELPGFTYQGWLGSGGFADVFSYIQDDLDREVAVKVLLADLPEEAATLFASEINLMAKLSSHPSIVSVYQAGVASDGRPFLVMEMCPPPTLRGRLRREPYDVSKTLEIGIQISSAIETSHRLGVVHRDIKPSNILFTEYGRAALTDFGISIPTSSVPGAETAYSVAWAPPEQIRNQTLVPATDIYSLGATLWAMLSGRSPFEDATGDNDYETIQYRNLFSPVPAIGRGDVPQSLERILLAAMDKDPDNRPSSALDFARELQKVQAELGQPRTTIDVRVDATARAKARAEEAYEGTKVATFDSSLSQAPEGERPATSANQPRTTTGRDVGSTRYWLPLTQGERPSWWADEGTSSRWTHRPTNQRPGAWDPLPTGPSGPPGPAMAWQHTGSGYQAPAHTTGFGPAAPQLPVPPPPPALPAPRPAAAGISVWTKTVLIGATAFVMTLIILIALL